MTTLATPVPNPLPAAPGRLRSIDLCGPAGRLEGLLNQGLPDASYAALVCHPHPLGGGNLHNKVVYHAMKALNDPVWGLGWPVLRFNFRGTGRSAGAHHGRAEGDDVQAALAWLEAEYRRPLVAVGFSFGAAMAVSACCATAGGVKVRALALLGLPAHAEGRDYSYPSLALCSIPKLFISGDRDRFASSAQLEAVATAAAEPKRLQLLSGADHFFTGQLESMQSALAGWLHTALAKEPLQ
jgi:hypothetical protein